MLLAYMFAVVALVQAAPAPEPASAAGSVVRRFQQVDEKLYRGAQPDAAGFRYLRDLGVKTVINLRSEEDARKQDERRIVESLGMRYLSLPVKDGNFFTRGRIIPDEAVREFFAGVDASAGPVFVHCHRGADRTGALVALYRIARHGWDNQRAYAEARTLGMRSWYSGLKRQILGFHPPREAVANTPHGPI